MKCLLCNWETSYGNPIFDRANLFSHLNGIHFNNFCPLCGQFANYLREHARWSHPEADPEDFIHAFLLGANPEPAKPPHENENLPF